MSDIRQYDRREKTAYHAAMGLSAFCTLAACLGTVAAQDGPRDAPIDPPRPAMVQTPVIMADTALQETGTANCLDMRQVASSSIDTARRVMFYLKTGDSVLFELAEDCPPLPFHDYFTYVPVGNMLCAGRDSLISRTGERCPISRITVMPSEQPEMTGISMPENGSAF